MKRCFLLPLLIRLFSNYSYICTLKSNIHINIWVVFLVQSQRLRVLPTCSTAPTIINIWEQKELVW